MLHNPAHLAEAEEDGVVFLIHLVQLVYEADLGPREEQELGEARLRSPAFTSLKVTEPSELVMPLRDDCPLGVDVEEIDTPSIKFPFESFT